MAGICSILAYSDIGQIRNSRSVFQKDSPRENSVKKQNSLQYKNSSFTGHINNKQSLQAASFFKTNNTDEKLSNSQKLRRLIREMDKQKPENHGLFGTIQNTVNSFLEKSETPEEDELKKYETASKYSYSKIASKIMSAKTSLSAGQAELSAKRAVLQIKSKISSGSGDPEELQIALTHAKRMEMTARKKKHHLELEEMVVASQKRDDRLKQQENAMNSIRNALIDAEEEKITGKEDEIFEERADMLEDLAVLEEDSSSDGAESSKDLPYDAVIKINEMISEFGEEELEELEESMEMLESAEIVNPHMSKEDLEELKKKHRASENKAIVKANMEYLKDMLKYVSGKSGNTPATTTATHPVGYSTLQNTQTATQSILSMPTPTANASVAIDISI